MKTSLRFSFPLFASLAFAAGAFGDDVSDLLTDAQRTYIRGDLAAAKEKFGLVRKLDPNNRIATAYLRRITADEQTQQAGKAPPSATEAALRKIILEKVDYQEATLPDALEFLRQKGNQLGAGKVAVNFVLQLDEAAKNSKVTLTLQQVPFTEALRYIGELANVQFTYEPYAIVVKSKGAVAPASTTNPSQRQDGIKIEGL
jgi:hypothetical protein